MKTIKIGNEDYILEFSFRAAMEQEVVQMMFDILVSADILKSSAESETEAAGVLNGMAKMASSIPMVATKAFYAGLLEHHENISRKEANDLMIEYMKQENISFRKIYVMVTDCMEDDGFFNKSGLTEMVEELASSIDENLEAETKTEMETKKKPSTTTKKK
jgi:hypothetical protein